MIITTKSRYAVAAMVDIALQNHTQPISLQMIAERQNIDLSYLEQIFLKLRKSGLVSAVKGPKGGYMPTISPNEIYISAILSAVDESLKMTRCDSNSSKGCMKNEVKCLTHNLWDGLSNQIQDYLSNISLQDICNENLVTV